MWLFNSSAQEADQLFGTVLLSPVINQWGRSTNKIQDFHWNYWVSWKSQLIFMAIMGRMNRGLPVLGVLELTPLESNRFHQGACQWSCLKHSVIPYLLKTIWKSLPKDTDSLLDHLLLDGKLAIHTRIQYVCDQLLACKLKCKCNWQGIETTRTAASTEDWFQAQSMSPVQ